MQAAGELDVTTRSLAVVIGDFEQEACFILLIWGTGHHGLQRPTRYARTRHAGAPATGYP